MFFDSHKGPAGCRNRISSFGLYLENISLQLWEKLPSSWWIMRHRGDKWRWIWSEDITHYMCENLIMKPLFVWSLYYFKTLKGMKRNKPSDELLTYLKCVKNWLMFIFICKFLTIVIYILYVGQFLMSLWHSLGPLGKRAIVKFCLDQLVFCTFPWGVVLITSVWCGNNQPDWKWMTPFPDLGP